MPRVWQFSSDDRGKLPLLVATVSTGALILRPDGEVLPGPCFPLAPWEDIEDEFEEEEESEDDEQ
jgi:hypothetical protein